MEFHQGKAGGWMLIGECSEEGIGDEGVCPYLVITLVRKHPKAESMKTQQPSVDSLEEEKYKPD